MPKTIPIPASAQERRIILIEGAGGVGVSTALFLAAMLDPQNFEVKLATDGDDIYDGATRAANIHHINGLEYAGIDRKTGKHCTEGGVTDQLLFPFELFKTGDSRPTWFMLTGQTLDKTTMTKHGQRVTLTEEFFHENAERAQAHYDKIYYEMPKEMQRNLVKPQKFTNKLDPQDFKHFNKLIPRNIVSAHASSGTGFNMAHYKAYMQLLLEQSGIEIIKKFDTKTIDTIGEDKHKHYIVHGADGQKIKADYLILTAANHNPELSGKISVDEKKYTKDFIQDKLKLKLGFEPTKEDCDNLFAAHLKHCQSVEGTYHLNMITHVRLKALGKPQGIVSTAITALKKMVGASPPGQDELSAERKKELANNLKINFAIQGEGGVMLACTVPPTEDKDGMAVLYYPHTTGSQIAKHRYVGADRTLPPSVWDQQRKDSGERITKPLSQDERERITAIIDQLHRVNPFTIGYITVEDVTHVIKEVVFNPVTELNPLGDIREQRPMIAPAEINHNVLVMHSPKLTTVNLAALTTAHKALIALTGKGFPVAKSGEVGYGVSNLDLPKIAALEQMKKFKMALNKGNIKHAIKVASDYTKINGLPERLVNPEQFERIIQKQEDQSFAKAEKKRRKTENNPLGFMLAQKSNTKAI